jgi:hypothetical protein
MMKSRLRENQHRKIRTALSKEIAVASLAGHINWKLDAK